MFLRGFEKVQRIFRQTTHPLWYPVRAQLVTRTNQADPHRPMLEHEGSDHQQIDQVLWHWARVLDGRSRFGTRCGTVPLWGPSRCWGAGAGIRKLPTLDNGLRNFDATLRSNPPAPPATSYSCPTIIIPKCWDTHSPFSRRAFMATSSDGTGGSFGVRLLFHASCLTSTG